MLTLSTVLGLQALSDVYTLAIEQQREAQALEVLRLQSFIHARALTEALAELRRYLAGVLGKLPADAELARLWAGDLSANNGDHSAADLSLCLKLAFYCESKAAAVDGCFRQSKLMREKWDEVHYSHGAIYGEHTITKAIGRYQAPQLSGGSTDMGTLTTAVTVQANGTGHPNGHSEGAPAHIGRRLGDLTAQGGVELMTKILPEPRWAVDGFLPEGLTVLAGNKGTGKSWLALNVALAYWEGY
jgi:hypothetical protein